MNLEWKSGRRLRRLCGGLGLAALGLLASCGGGTLQNAFSPQRIVSFGDEASAIVIANVDGVSVGQKYSVNYVDTTTTPVTHNCALYPNWTQYLANQFNLPFPECVATGLTAPSVMRAFIGAKVGDVTTQIDTQVANGGFTGNDLVTIMVGENDILEQYALYAAGSLDLGSAQSTLADRARAVAAQVDRVVALGGKVLISTVPNAGLTPFGVADAQRSADLGTLSLAFNDALRTALVNDSGRNVGLILSDQIVRLDATFPDSYGLTNVTGALCSAPATVDLTGCDVRTQQSTNAATTWLWAGTYMLGPTPQGQIGSQAYTRATNNPF